MMADKNTIVPFSPEDMKRRRLRNIAVALALVAFMVIIFVTSIVKMRTGN